MSRWVDICSSRTAWNLYGLDNLQRARRMLAGDGQRTVAATGKGIAVKLRSIDARTNHRRGDNLAIIRTPAIR